MAWIVAPAATVTSCNTQLGPMTTPSPRLTSPFENHVDVDADIPRNARTNRRDIQPTGVGHGNPSRISRSAWRRWYSAPAD